MTLRKLRFTVKILLANSKRPDNHLFVKTDPSLLSSELVLLLNVKFLQSHRVYVLSHPIQLYLLSSQWVFFHFEDIHFTQYLLFPLRAENVFYGYRQKSPLITCLSISRQQPNPAPPPPTPSTLSAGLLATHRFSILSYKYPSRPRNYRRNAKNNGQG